jgi:hypothetical protein
MLYVLLEILMLDHGVEGVERVNDFSVHGNEPRLVEARHEKFAAG